MGLIALGVAGAALGAGGTALSASSASKKRKELSDKTGEWLPTIPQNTRDWFADLKKYQPESAALARDIGEDDLATTMALREKATPGITRGIEEGAAALFPLLKGELPDSVLKNFMRSGGASSVGLGWGGSQFGDLNTALFGARGSLGAMEFGYGLLPSLLGASPQVRAPSSGTFLSGIMTPGDRTQTQLAVRGQNLGIASQVAGMPTSSEVWGNFLSSTGGMMLGAATSGAGGGMGGGGGGTKANIQAIQGMGYQAPSNFGSLSPGQQDYYVNLLQRNQGFNWSGFE